MMLLFRNNTRERVATLEEDSIITDTRVQELDRQVVELQAVVEALVITNQQMIKDMKNIYDNLTVIMGNSEAAGSDKYFVSIINNSGGGKLPH